MGNMTFEQLQKTSGWVALNYHDGSQRIFETTLNVDILESMVNPVHKDGHLFDINNGVWVEIPPFKDASATLTRNKPEQNEVNEFASRFIR